MLSKLSPPHVEDPAQYVHIPKRHSGIFRDHGCRIESSWSHHLLDVDCAQSHEVPRLEVCILLPFKLARSQQESFA